MNFVDTHTHLYLDEFNDDRDKVISDAIQSGVNKFLLPNIDSSSIGDMLALADKYPENCLPMIGLHPTSVKANYLDELAIVEQWLNDRKFYGIGECGIDHYWDKTFTVEQEFVFRHHIDLALAHDLPLIVHIRESFNEVIRILKDVNKSSLYGIFHCFSGSTEQAVQAIKYNFSLGIGGVVTFKNNKMQETLTHIDLQHLVFETDAPFLAPVPFRGKRNEPSYIPLIARKVAEIMETDIEKIAEVTSQNAYKLFKLDQ